MKDTDVIHSIGAALQACAARVSAKPTTTTQRPLAPKPAAAAPRERQATPHMRLTTRQLEVLALLCEGLPNKVICRRLNIATGTVKVHISCIFRELGVASRLQAVVAARNLRLCAETAAAALERPADPLTVGRPVQGIRHSGGSAGQLAAAVA